jgi:U3 small nucleolar RNA-associated protein 25
MELAMAAVEADGPQTDKSSKKKVKGKIAKENLLRDVSSQAADLEHYQDQGFCRARVLILCPFRGTAKKCVDEMLQVLGPDRTSVANRDKFEEEFGPPDDDGETTDSSDSEEEEDAHSGDGQNPAGRARGNKKRKRKSKPAKPEDWIALFKNTNVDDDFKLGVQINPGQGKNMGTGRGAYVRLFSDFYQSDVIIASPIGLRFIIEKGENGSKNADFLSSVEMVVLHQADVMYMQNWDHVEFVLQHTNKLCEIDRGTDFARVRPYFLEGKAAEHRQLIFTSHFNEPSMQACFRANSHCLAGTVRLKKQWGDGCLPLVASRVRQVFQRVPTESIATQEDDRFQYFVDTVLNQIIRLEQSHTLIVTPSYLSFIRIRNELQRREVS